MDFNYNLTTMIRAYLRYRMILYESRQMIETEEMMK